MCTRYTLVADAEKVAERFNVDVPKQYQPNYNAAPAKILPVITHDTPTGLSFFYWGIPPEWAQKRAVSSKLINAPLEQLSTKNSYKNALEKRRCIIPSDGFYAWKQIGKKTRVPHRFILGDNSIFSYAGFWDEFEGEEDGEIYHTFMIITCPANRNVKDVDERMPVILTKETEKQWLKKDASLEELMELLVPYPDDKLNKYTVSNKIDQSEENSPLLIKPSSPVDQFGSYTLFD
ncbi:MAG: SOS response-associated peptidase [Candidatus Cyclobacteriaceae bacterium M2_1C_046]